MKEINYNKYKFFVFYVVGFISLTLLIYLTIPFFFNYNSYKENIEKKIFINFNLKAEIKGQIKYTFIPSPRISIKNITLKDFPNIAKRKINVQEMEILVPFKTLVKKETINLDKIIIKDAEIDLNLENIDGYFNLFKNFKAKPIVSVNSKLNFYNKKNYIASIENIDLKYEDNNYSKKTTIKGKFLSDDLEINLETKINQRTLPNILKIKLKKLGLLVKLTYPNTDNAKSGNIQISFKNNKVSFNYLKNNKFIAIDEGKIKNNYIDGNIIGKIFYNPFFNFDLYIDLNQLNFKKVYKKISKFQNQNNNIYSNVSKKLNGNVNININNIYSVSKLIKSLETSIELINGEIIFQKLLLNLGKIGASDITGIYKNNEKLNGFKFKQNIYIDDLKYFRQKFGIIKRNTRGPKSVHISALINFKRDIISIQDIIFDKKFEKDEIKFVEDNINSIMFSDGFKSFFNFTNLVEFLKVSLEND